MSAICMKIIQADIPNRDSFKLNIKLIAYLISQTLSDILKRGEYFGYRSIINWNESSYT